MAENLTKIYNRVLASLKWPVEKRLWDETSLQITCVTARRRHVMSIPRRGDAVREIEFLHELAHARLAEDVHPLLATGVFVPRPPDHVLRELVWPTQSAADWFADALLWEWAPHACAMEIREHLGYVLATTVAKLSNGQLFYAGGLICAQARYWKIMPFEAPQLLQPVIDVLLRFQPEKPTLAKMQALLNALAELTTPYRVRAVENNGETVWAVE